jgi:hypothetical protein
MGNTLHIWAAWSSLNDELLLQESWQEVLQIAKQANKTQVTFTSVLGFDDANGYDLSEMALVLNNDILYSMATFAPLSKTSDIQIIWNWRVNLL